MPSDVTFSLASGEITGKSWGEQHAPLVLCLPGFSQDERSFDALAPALAETHHVVALALRGRGRSTSAPDAPWGAEHHARDVLEIASALEHQSVALVGWSFGGLVAMNAAELAPDRVSSIVLIDVAGTPDPSTSAAVGGNQVRLTMTFDTEDDYVEHVLSGGLLAGAEDFFRDYLRGELVPVDGGGFRTRTTAAIAQDAAAMATRPIEDLWPALTMPVLLVRATEPVVPGSGHIVSEAVRDGFLASVPAARCVEVPVNHGAIGVVRETVDAARDFLAPLP